MAKTSVENKKITFSSEKAVKNPLLVFFFGKTHPFFALIAFFLCFSSLNIIAQNSQESADIQNTLQTLIEDFIEFNESGADFDFNTLYEELFVLYNEKLDLNKAAATDFRILFFLSDVDIHNIISHRKSFGNFLSIYELQSVPGLTADKLSTLKLFVRIKEPGTVHTNLSIEELTDHHDQLYLKWKYTVETAKGFKSINGSEPKYIGDKNHLYLRYNHTSPNESYGLILEKDPGEQLTNSFSETGIDYLSFHYQLKPSTPWIRQINLGDYNVSMGQGLLAHSSFGLGKSSFTTKVKKGRQGFRAYKSVNENQAFRGIALDIGHQDFPLSTSFFASYMPRDANLTGVNGDGRPIFSSLPTSGLHRTSSEEEDQDGAYEITIGSNLRYKYSDRIRFGINAIHTGFDKYLEPGTQPYQLYRWSGDQLTNVSVDYNLLIKGWNLFGEIARSANGGLAQINGLIKSLDPNLDLSLVYRNYGVEYQSLYSNAFGESSTVNNERGIYLGIEYRPAKKWTIKAYIDNWKNDWLKFRVDAPGGGQEYLMRIDFKEKRKRQYYLQYRYEIKDENSTADLLVDYPVTRTIQRLRLHTSHQLGNGLELRTRLEGSLFQKERKTASGFFVYQDVISRKLASPSSLSGRIGYFNITDFSARIYAYENDLLFEYYIPSFNGHGLRYYVHYRHNISHALMAEIRWEQTKYFDRQVISSNNNLIEGSTLSRIKAQMRWRF